MWCLLGGRILIKHLDNQDYEQAQVIHEITQAAYQQEALWLGVTFFPPLARTVENIIADAGLYLGIFTSGVLQGVLHLEEHHINALAVHPRMHRQGLAANLLKAALAAAGRHQITVSTGVLNKPALALYHKMGFAEIGREEKGGIALVHLAWCSGLSSV